MSSNYRQIELSPGLEWNIISVLNEQNISKKKIKISFHHLIALPLSMTIGEAIELSLEISLSIHKRYPIL